jgi:hypothetical protein
MGEPLGRPRQTKFTRPGEVQLPEDSVSAAGGAGLLEMDQVMETPDKRLPGQLQRQAQVPPMDGLLELATVDELGSKVVDFPDLLHERVRSSAVSARIHATRCASRFVPPSPLPLRSASKAITCQNN